MSAGEELRIGGRVRVLVASPLCLCLCLYEGEMWLRGVDDPLSCIDHSQMRRS